jgi:hypothetical protein
MIEPSQIKVSRTARKLLAELADAVCRHNEYAARPRSAVRAELLVIVKNNIANLAAAVSAEVVKPKNPGI